MLQKLSVKCKNQQQKVDAKEQDLLLCSQFQQLLASFSSVGTASLYCAGKLLPAIGSTEQQTEIVYE